MQGCVRSFVLVAVIVSASTSDGRRALAQTPVDGEPIVLWPGGAPGAVGSEPDDTPALTPFFPKAHASGAAVISRGAGASAAAPPARCT